MRLQQGFEQYPAHDEALFWSRLNNRSTNTALAVPIGVVVAIALALMMDQNVREVAIYRAAFYLPSIIPLFALTFIFIVLLNPGFGFVDFVLGLFKIPAVNWLGDARWTRLSIVLLAQLGAGGRTSDISGGLRAVPI